jgi:hypothetical protein
MFKQKTVKTSSIFAIILSIWGLIFSIFGFVFFKTETSTVFVISLISWSFFLYGSIIGYQLCKNYQLYPEEYKKVGIRIYLIILFFFLFFFGGVTIGIVGSVVLFGSLYSLKKNYDEWDYSTNAETQETIE